MLCESCLCVHGYTDDIRPETTAKQLRNPRLCSSRACKLQCMAHSSGPSYSRIDQPSSPSETVANVSVYQNVSVRALKISRWLRVTLLLHTLTAYVAHGRCGITQTATTRCQNRCSPYLVRPRLLVSRDASHLCNARVQVFQEHTLQCCLA